MSAEEVVVCMEEKYHPDLNPAFIDAGMPVIQGKVTGSLSQVVTALKNKAEEKLLHIISSVTRLPGGWRQCSLHQFANYTVQDLLEAAHRLREAADSEGTWMLDGYRHAHGGRDPFGSMWHHISENVVELSRHTTGTYVVQKGVERCNAEELLVVTTKMFGAAVDLCGDQYGVFALLKALKSLDEKVFCCDEVQPEGLAVVDQLCCCFLDNLQNTRFFAHHALSGRVLVQAVQLGLPKMGALKLAAQLCSGAKFYLNSKNGIVNLSQLLDVRARDPFSRSLVRDLTCIMAASLQGTYSRLVLGDDQRGLDLVKQLVDRLEEEQEVGWIEVVIRELVNVGDVLVQHEDRLEVLKHALVVRVLDLPSVEEHVRELEQLLEEEQVDDIWNDVVERVQCHPPPPPPKYPAPSYIQPALTYHLMKGGALPPPPPPPGASDRIQDTEATSSQEIWPSEVQPLQPLPQQVATWDTVSPYEWQGTTEGEGPLPELRVSAQIEDRKLAGSWPQARQEVDAFNGAPQSFGNLGPSTSGPGNFLGDWGEAPKETVAPTQYGAPLFLSALAPTPWSGEDQRWPTDPPRAQQAVEAWPHVQGGLFPAYPAYPRPPSPVAIPTSVSAATPHGATSLPQALSHLMVRETEAIPPRFRVPPGPLAPYRPLSFPVQPVTSGTLLGTPGVQPAVAAQGRGQDWSQGGLAEGFQEILRGQGPAPGPLPSVPARDRREPAGPPAPSPPAQLQPSISAPREAPRGTIVLTPRAPQPPTEAAYLPMPQDQGTRREDWGLLAAGPGGALPRGSGTQNVPQPVLGMAPYASPSVVPRPTPIPSHAPVPSRLDRSWMCQLCTYYHDGPEAEFLLCAVCGVERGK